MAGSKLKKGDRVVVITGKDKGREGKVLFVDSKKNKLIVEGINMMTKHIQANKDVKMRQGGISRREAPLDCSKVMYLYNGRPTRLGTRVTVSVGEDGKKTVTKQRVARKTGEVLD